MGQVIERRGRGINQVGPPPEAPRQTDPWDGSHVGQVLASIPLFERIHPLGRHGSGRPPAYRLFLLGGPAGERIH
jgi:hypothetical protein